jgi:hypothetical protein
VTGTVIMAKPDSFYSYNASADSWRGLVKNPIFNFDAAYAGFFSISTYGVIALASTYSYPVLLYKYADPAAVESNINGSPLKTATLSAIPNPSGGNIRLIINSGSMHGVTGRLGIFDMNGRLVLGGQVDLTALATDGLALEAAGLPVGVYTAKLSFKRQCLICKIILQR